MKLITFFLLPFVFQFAVVSRCFAVENLVEVKCEILYNGPDSPPGTPIPIDKFVETMKLTSIAFGKSTNFKFDEIHTFAKIGHPNLKVWLHGNYFRNENQVDAYLRFSTSLCEDDGTHGGLKCYDTAYSGDVFARTVIQHTVYRGKNIQSFSNDMVAKEAASGTELQFNYRLKTGRSMEENTDYTDPVARKKYLDIVLPVVAVNCSVRDDGFAVEGIF